MNNPLGVSPSKGKQGTTRGKEKIFLTSVGIEVKKIFSLPRVVPCFPLLGLTPSGLFMGLKGHCHAIWQLYKKLGVFASIEFQN